MTIGVLSDTHGNGESLPWALQIFRDAGVEVLLHAGDFGQPGFIDYFDGFRLYLARGNCDVLEDLRPFFSEHKQPDPRVSQELEYGGKKILLMHGDDVLFFRDAIARGGFDYLIKGHTHFSEDYMRGQTRILNPGALSRSERLTVGLLDPEQDSWVLKEIG